MKFHCQRNGKTIWIRVENHDSATLDFRRELTTEFEAQVVAQAISHAMGERIEQIRKEAYDTGWRDHSKKRTKRTVFYRCINGDGVGY